MNLTERLTQIDGKIQKVCRENGLDFFETIFYVLPYDYLIEVAAHGGFPRRYFHWTYGMQYEKLRRTYEWGMGKIYEMVINNDPCYAYLLETNSFLEQKLVIAHVYAHCDFFKNNIYFSKTPKNMIDDLANHAGKIDKYMKTYGVDTVEAFLDAVMSIQDHIDFFSVFSRKRKSKKIDKGKKKKEENSKKYMEIFYEDSIKKKVESKPDRKTNPKKDLLKFLINNADLKKWQEDILYMIRKERYYFMPQAMTKIINEGWASYWHYKIMTEYFVEKDEIIEFSLDHSGTLAKDPRRLNPYWLGFELLKDIEDRWNKGRFGKEWEECKDPEKKKNWDMKLGIGREKIFEVRRYENDYSFIEKYLTEDFCDKHKLFKYAYNTQTKQMEEVSRKFSEIKDQFLNELSNYGIPYILVMDDNYMNRKELLLKHVHEGNDLKSDFAIDTLKNIYSIWNRPVHMQTIMDKKEVILSYPEEKK
ncbi:SpoVR family protein [bacterium]|nr:SpoVR family protein [bacterium]